MQEAKNFAQSLTPEERQLFNEWEELLAICDIAPGRPLGSIIIPTGGWMERVHEGFEQFQQANKTQERPPKLVITGENGSQYLLPKLSANAPKIARAIRIYGGLTPEEKNRIVIEGKATNTKDQAVNVYEMLRDGEIEDPLLLVVSAWHLPRNYMTFVKHIMDHEGENLRTRMYTIPVFGDWDEATRDDPNHPRKNRIIPEMERIHRYQEKGDVATRKELVRYVTWLKQA